MENYGDFSWDGNTMDDNKFPDEFYYHIQAGIQRLEDRRLITFKGYTLDNALFVVTPDFMELWDDPGGLAKQAERVEFRRKMCPREGL